MFVTEKLRQKIPAAWQGLSVAELISKILVSCYGNYERPVLVAFGGTGGVGKSTLTKEVAANLIDCAILPLDDYKTSRQDRQLRKILGSHPAANRLDLLHQHILAIKAGEIINRPIYNAISGKIDGTQPFQPAKFNLLDGEISTYQELSHHADLVIFVEAAFHTQLKTRLMRDVVERGSSHFKALRTFCQSNLVDYHRFGRHGKDLADLLIYCERNYKLRAVSINQKLVGA